MDGELLISVGLLILSALTTFLVRVGFRVLSPRSTGGDVWYHLHAAEEIRKNRFRMPTKLNRYSLNTPFDTPSLIYTFLALLPKRWRERDFLYGPLADSLQSSTAFILVHVITANPYLAFTSAVAFALAPILVKPDARVFFFSPRPWAELFGSVAILFGVFTYVRFDVVVLFLSILFGSLTLLTSKFGAQAMLFLSIGLTVTLFTWIFLTVLLFSFFLAVVISKGFYLKVLRGHAKHSNFYRTTIAERHSGTLQVAGLRELGESLKTRTRVLNVLARNPIISTLAFFPFLPFAWLTFILSPGAFSSNALILTLLIWASVGFAVVVVISTRQLRFLGEADRYQNYAVLPVCVAVPVILGISNMAILWMLFVLIIAYSAALIRQNYVVAVRYFGSSSEDEKSSSELFSYLDGIPQEVILCVPFNVAPEISYKTHHSTVYWGGNLPAENFTPEDFRTIFDNFPYPKDNLAIYCRKTRAGLVLFHKRFMGPLSPSHYNLTELTRVFENEGFEVYRVGGESESALEETSTQTIPDVQQNVPIL